MRPERIASLLGRTSLFGKLDDRARELVSRRAMIRTYRRGDAIFYQGDPGTALFVVAEGDVMVHVTSPDGEDMVLARLGPGETFGELALVDGGPRTASARALSAASLVAIPRDAFAAMLREHPDLTEALLRSLGTLLRRILEQASDLVFLDLQGRVAKLLIGLADRHGNEVEGGIRLDLGMSQSNLAGMVGGSRPTVNQILKSFEAKGYLELTGRQILVKSPDHLRRRAGL